MAQYYYPVYNNYSYAGQPAYPPEFYGYGYNYLNNSIYGFGYNQANGYNFDYSNGFDYRQIQSYDYGQIPNYNQNDNQNANIIANNISDNSNYKVYEYKVESQKDENKLDENKSESESKYEHITIDDDKYEDTYEDNFRYEPDSDYVDHDEYDQHRNRDDNHYYESTTRGEIEAY